MPPLQPGCPRCAEPVERADGGWSCPGHGHIRPLWQPVEAAYESFSDHLTRAAGFPTYLPWPLSPGWRVSDFGVVADVGGRGRATVSCSSGTSDLDGAVEVLVVAEEPDVGLGARVAGVPGPDPGPDFGHGQPVVRLRVDHNVIALWSVPTPGVTLDRMVLAGEAHGRWLWLVLRPASAVLLLRDDWILRDLAGAGPQLVDLPFGGPPPPW